MNRKRGDIWRKIIPGVAITLQLGFESVLDAAFVESRTVCQGGNQETIFRTVAFCISGTIGLLFMKWKDFRTKNNWPDWIHYIVNVATVVAWLLAISNFPLVCWIDDEGTISDLELRGVALTRAFLVVLIQALASAEVFVLYDENKSKPTAAADGKPHNCVASEGAGLAVVGGGGDDDVELKGDGTRDESSTDETGQNDDVVPVVVVGDRQEQFPSDELPTSELHAP